MNFNQNSVRLTLSDALFQNVGVSATRVNLPLSAAAYCNGEAGTSFTSRLINNAKPSIDKTQQKNSIKHSVTPAEVAKRSLVLSIFLF